MAPEEILSSMIHSPSRRKAGSHCSYGTVLRLCGRVKFNLSPAKLPTRFTISGARLCCHAIFSDVKGAASGEGGID
jgi:hypothetical protein